VPPPFGCTPDARPAVMQSTAFFVFFTVRCITVQSAVLLSHVVCPSVCDVGGEILGRLGVGWEKVACWITKAAISLKRVKIEEKLLWRAYRKSSTLFWFWVAAMFLLPVSPLRCPRRPFVPSSMGCMGKNNAKTAVSVAIEAKPEVEIWRRPPKSTFWSWFPLHSFRQFLVRTYRFATIQKSQTTTDRQATDDTLYQRQRLKTSIPPVLS